MVTKSKRRVNVTWFFRFECKQKIALCKDFIFLYFKYSFNFMNRYCEARKTLGRLNVLSVFQSKKAADSK
jgi:hypothetical protein